jgi:probable F420-dependent oxidoreductase
MKVGVNLVNFGAAATPGTLAKWAEVVETLGFHHLMTSDHVTITPDVAQRFPAPFYEPLTTLGWLAGITKDISIGASVIILPYRSPLEVARAFANIDQLSGGRSILGVGVGWAREEYAALNVPFEKRGAIANEYLAAIRQMWTEDVSSFDGKYIRFTDVHSAPMPVQSPHPPIWVGGGSDAAIRRAVRFGDAWHPFRATVASLRDTGVPKLHTIAETENKPPPAICPRILLRITDSDLPEDARVAGEGSLDQIHRDLAELEELGCTDVLLDAFTDDGRAARDQDYAWRMLEAIAEKVVDLNGKTVR